MTVAGVFLAGLIVDKPAIHPSGQTDGRKAFNPAEHGVDPPYVVGWGLTRVYASSFAKNIFWAVSADISSVSAILQACATVKVAHFFPNFL